MQPHKQIYTTGSLPSVYTHSYIGGNNIYVHLQLIRLKLNDNVADGDDALCEVGLCRDQRNEVRVIPTRKHESQLIARKHCAAFGVECVHLIVWRCAEGTERWVCL